MKQLLNRRTVIIAGGGITGLKSGAGYCGVPPSFHSEEVFMRWYKRRIIGEYVLVSMGLSPDVPFELIPWADPSTGILPDDQSKGAVFRRASGLFLG